LVSRDRLDFNITASDSRRKVFLIGDGNMTEPLLLEILEIEPIKI
jgi:hypothetical protein